MNYTIEELKNTLDYYNNLADNIINEAIYIIMPKFIYIDGDMLQRYREYIEKNNFEENYPFNIFELISDIYYRENFHSDIIAKLFENKIVLKNFLNYIGVDSNKYIDCQITREESRIDILIKTDSNCIIIENKLHWAPDMPEQLFKYYNKCKNSKELEVDKIVYLSPNSYKKPVEDSIKEIPKELIKIIIGYDGENEDFYTMVIEKSLKEMNDNEPKEWLLLLEHYLKILRKTGVTKMDALTKKFYEKIKTEPQEYEKVKLIVDMYNSLTIARVNSLVERFEGNYNNQCFWREFYSEKRGIKYEIDIYTEDYKYSGLQLFSREQIPDKLEQDNKDIEAWLKKHNLFEGFYIHYGRWSKKFKFPEEENKLYEYTEKLIKCLKEDVESIYSEK